uniref:DNA repair RAD52-like protein 2, chloroplastic n=1 Tax=Ananas comosus var. bracteatus TaxID=296719 RepID=A0A6V7Q831_ANACO|nr:unnamed protein product [Ananas comosus var. bracteatus]
MDAAFSAAAPSALFASSSSAGAAAAARGDRAGLRKARLSWSWSGGGAALRRRAAVAAAAAEGGGEEGRRSADDELRGAARQDVGDHPAPGGDPQGPQQARPRQDHQPRPQHHPLEKGPGLGVEMVGEGNRYHANRMLSFYAPGWCGEVRDVKYCDSGSVTVVYRVTIRGTDGEAHREATGTVSLQDGRFEDAVAAAEEAAFCKACARFGFGLYLYHKDEIPWRE